MFNGVNLIKNLECKIQSLNLSLLKKIIVFSSTFKKVENEKNRVDVK